MTSRRALLSLGANLPLSTHASGAAGGARGTPSATIAAALGRLRALGPLRASRMYITPAVPEGSGPDFVNACASLVTDLDAPALLRRLHAAERAMGRERLVRWAPRTLDIDLLDLGGQVLPSLARWAGWRRLPAQAQLRLAPRRPVLPHPRLQDRAFVLVPLCDVAPGWRHPVTGRTARDMRDALPQAQRAAIRRM